MEGKQLNNKELQFLDYLSLYQPNVQVTQLLIKDMQFDDLIHSDFKQFGQFSASDLILQLSQTFDDQLFIDILSNIYHKRTDNQLYLQQQEKLLWIEESRLNDEEQKDLQEMLSKGKVSDQYVDLINHTDYPLKNLYSWIHAKFVKKFNLSLLDQNNSELWNNIFKLFTTSYNYNSVVFSQLNKWQSCIYKIYLIIQRKEDK